MNTIYQLPTWAETVLVICVAVMLAGLSAYLAMKAITEAINAESKLQRKKAANETLTISKWQKLYEEEHQKRADDNASFVAKIIDLECEVKRMKEILGKVKVADL